MPLVTYDLSPLTIKSVEAFPMTPTGKIAKAELRQSALAAVQQIDASLHNDQSVE